MGADALGLAGAKRNIGILIRTASDSRSRGRDVSGPRDRASPGVGKVLARSIKQRERGSIASRPAPADMMGRLPLVWGATHDRNHQRRADLAAQGPRPVRTCDRRSCRRERCRRTGSRGADGGHDAPSGTTRRPSRQAAGAAHRPHREASRKAPVTPVPTRRRGSERKTCSALPARLSPFWRRATAAARPRPARLPMSGRR